MCERQEAYLNAHAHGLTLAQQNKLDAPVMMSDVLLSYLEEYRLSHRAESHALMEHTLNEFHGWCHKNLVAKITRVDLLSIGLGSLVGSGHHGRRRTRCCV
jgi:hypothetical protein